MQWSAAMQVANTENSGSLCIKPTGITLQPRIVKRVARYTALLNLLQGMLLVVAVALFAVLSVTNVRGPGTGFVSVLLYTLIVWNLTTPTMHHLAPFPSRLRFPFDWVAYLTAVATVSLTLSIMMVLVTVGRGCFVVSMIGNPAA
jgi:hypothetical protein